MMVEEVMSVEFYFVVVDVLLKEVVVYMVEYKYGVVVIMEGKKVKGIFIIIDVLRALAEWL